MSQWILLESKDEDTKLTVVADDAQVDPCGGKPYRNRELSTHIAEFRG